MTRGGNALYRVLVSAAPVARTAIGERVWTRMWTAGTRRLHDPVSLTLHGRRALLNAGHPYPAFLRRWPTYNGPLVELVHQAAAVRGEPVNIVDVGAAVGDTALLLLDRCDGDVGHIVCIEGDDEFLHYLRHNLEGDPRITIQPALLSDAAEDIAALLRTHAGTASAQGTGTVRTTTLDGVAAAGALRVDVLKVDTDGFDGRVLGGATELLRRDRPAVIFEWHPRLYEATGNDWRQPFRVLQACGYRRMHWFTKFGTFSHTQDGPADADIETRARVCLSDSGPAPDWHYDVVAVPDGSTLDERALRELGYARRTQRRR